MNAWEAQFGYDFEERLDRILDECLTIKNTFNTSPLLSEKHRVLLKPSLLNNTLLALDKKISHQISILKQFNLPNNAPIKKLRKLSVSINREINDVEKYNTSNTYQKKCIQLLHEIIEWKKNTLIPYEEDKLVDFQKKLNRVEHEKVRLNKQRESLIKVLENTILTYHSNLIKTQPNKELRKVKFNSIFKNIAINDKQGVKLKSGFNAPELSTQPLLKVINIIFKRARKQTIYFQHPATTALLTALDNEGSRSSLSYRKKTFGKHKAFFRADYEKLISLLNQQLKEQQERLMDDKETKTLFHQKLVRFQTLYLNLKHHYDFKQRKTTKPLLQAYQLILKDNKQLMENLYPTPFGFKRVYPIFIDKTINKFDDICSFYYIRIRILINQIYRHSPNQSSHSLASIYKTTTTSKVPLLFPLITLLYKHQANLKDMSENLRPDETKTVICKSNAIGLLLLKKLIKQLNSAMRYTPYPSQSEKLIQYLDEFLSQPLLKNNSYKEDFMNYYNFIMKPLSDYTMDFITSPAGF